MSRSPLVRVRRALLVVAAAAVVWASIVALTGGFYLRVFGLRFSSRDYRDALLIALVSVLASTAIKVRISGWQAVDEEWARLFDRAVRPLRPLRTRAFRLSLVRRTAAPVRRIPWSMLAAALPTAIALAGTLLAISQWAGARPLWLDEEMILLNVRDRGWSGLGGLLWLGQSAPLGWMAAERAALLTLGSGEMALRLVPVLFGIGTIAAAFWIGRRWMGAAGAALLALLCAFGQHITHYSFEAKHYSADAFWGLLIPALAVWAGEGSSGGTRARRMAVWWLVAAVAQALSNGAALVLPGCALFLAASVWRRDGRRAALTFAGWGVIWLAAFGVHYQLSLRASHESTYLREYWSNELPPESMGIGGRVRWMAGRLEALAGNPAGTERWMSLWICSALGLTMGGRRSLGLVFATVPLSAFLLAGLGIVPLYQRFVLWMVPALYVGVALAGDRAVRVLRDALRRRRPAPAAVATVVLFVAGTVCADAFVRGWRDIALARPRGDKHHLDDRTAVRWLMMQVRPGDAIVTTRLGWPAVWWYGGISIASTDADGVVQHSAGIPLLEAGHATGSECDRDHLEDAQKTSRRVLVYLGFRDGPPGFDYLLLHSLDEQGAIQAFSHHSVLGRAAVIDLGDPSSADLTLPGVSSQTVTERVPLDGCVTLRPARRW